MKYRRGILIAIIILLVCGVSGYFLRDKILYNNHVVVTINGEKINDSEFKFILSIIKSNMEQQGLKDFNTIIEGKKAIDFAKERALESIKGYVIGAQQARKQGLKLTEEELNKVNNEADKTMQQTPKLTESGLTKEDLIRIYTNLSLSNKVQVMEQDKIGANIIISDQEAQTYYEGNKDKYTFDQEKVKARHILIKTIDDSGNELPNQDAIKAKAEEVLAKVKAGEDFVSLVTQYSEDEGSKKLGGEYTFGKGEMVKEFEDAAFSMKPGETSNLVKTNFGYHIIKLEAKYEKGQVESFEEAKDNIKTTIKNTKVEEEYNKKLEDWIKNSKIIKNDKVYNSIA